MSKVNVDGEEEPAAAPQTLRRHDSLDMESAHAHASKVLSWAVILRLAFQSIGVVYGDIGTSPLYVYATTFANGIKHQDDVLGVLSLIYYTFTLLPIVKYILIVLRNNDNGNGGTFALYSLLCRHVKVGLLPSTQPEDQQLSNYTLQLPKTRGLSLSLALKSLFENNHLPKLVLLFVTMLATALVIGDGILTPSISVLSAVGGITLATPAMTQDRVVWITVAILVLLFSVQRFGTDKVGYTFAPIVCIWLTLNAGIGFHNFIKYHPQVIKAVNPWYIVQYFARNGKEGWVSLGGVVLCITGLEAMFADLGHLTVRSIQISMCSLVYPSLMLTYSGQASYLMQFPENVSQTFFKSIPDPLYWPTYVVALLAAIIASQAMISGTFSIIRQSLSLGCFPRVTVIHTSSKHEGQVYIPELNFFLMIACVCVTLAFKTTNKIGNAYGIAVVFAEVITSTFMVLVMILIRKKHILLVVAYVTLIFSVEVVYLSSVLFKFPAGGYLPLAFACFFMAVMIVWNYVYRMKYYFEMDHKVSPDQLSELVSCPSISKIPGFAIFYSELVHGIPPIFKHYVTNVPALHSVLVFLSIKSLPVSKIPPTERFLFRRVHLKDMYVFRCVVRYGYTDDRKESEPSFEGIFFKELKEFVRGEALVRLGSGGEEEGDGIVSVAEREVETMEKAWTAGVVHLMGENEVIARKGSGMWKKVVIDYGYNFMRKNLRQSEEVLDVPRKRLLKVGMTYEL